jgi:hypothetical protein
MKLIVCIFSALALTACATSSGVLKTGPDTFAISTAASRGAGGVPAAKRAAYEQGAATCQAKGQELVTVSEDDKPQTWTDGMARVELTFRCQRAG